MFFLRVMSKWFFTCYVKMFFTCYVKMFFLRVMSKWFFMCYVKMFFYVLCQDVLWFGFDNSPNGTYALAGSIDGTLFIWNTVNGKLEKTLNGHR